MTRILISHESPISMLQDSVRYNDFDYCLCHLLFQEPAYKDYFMKARNVFGREIYLDTSVFELSKAFDEKKYVQSIKDIKPNAYIVPDVLEDCQATINSYEKFVFKYPELDELDGMKIGVIQGKDFFQIKTCYTFMSVYADMIAISFDMSYYTTNSGSGTWEEQMMRGRQNLVKELISSGVWNWTKPHHLLGISAPQELSFYRNNNIYNIRSVDTSSPIVHGLHNVRYNSTFGLKKKIKTKLADLINAKPDSDQLQDIAYNIDQFKRIVNG